MQDRLTYANGNTITTEGFRCTIGEPIDIQFTATLSTLDVDLYTINDRAHTCDCLITLEVNGENIAYRELHHIGGEIVTIGDYTISDDFYLSGQKNNDKVFLRIEPVELTVTDAFRAAVGKVAPKSEGGGGSGGGVLVVGATIDGNTVTLDKTWQEIVDADIAALKVQIDSMYIDTLHIYGAEEGTYWVHFGGPDGELPDFNASSASGYPSALMG